MYLKGVLCHYIVVVTQCYVVLESFEGCVTVTLAGSTMCIYRREIYLLQ